jgi:hypothetical protein
MIMGEISKHPEMGKIIASIRKIAVDQPCSSCKALKDDLNAAKSREKHWKDKYDEQNKILEGNRIPKELMRAICGGVFPNSTLFNFENVSEWLLEGKEWVPYDNGQPLARPKFKLSVGITPQKIITNTT